MTTKPLPPHGTYARARGNHRSGQNRCHCKPCRAAEGAYTKQQRYLKNTGRSLLTNAAPVAAHLRMLMSHGDALTLIAEQIGRPRSSLENIISGRTKRVRRHTAEQIMALTPGTAIAGNRSVPALGSIRRLRALMALAHRLKSIAEACAMDHSTASHLINGHTESIRYELAQRIKAGYDKLSTTRGTSARNINRAVRERWAPPAAWDDDTIDDPNGQPDFGDGVLNCRERAKLRREEIIHLAWHGHEPEQIVDRLGGELAISTVREIVQEWRTGQKRVRKQVAA